MKNSVKYSVDRPSISVFTSRERKQKKRGGNWTSAGQSREPALSAQDKVQLNLILTIDNPLCMYERSLPWFEKAFIKTF